MILPLWGQGCVVTYHGQQCIGEARKAYVAQAGKYEGQFVIDVRSPLWGYELAYPASEVRLLAVTFADGEIYDAEAAFQAKYTPAEIAYMQRAAQPVNRERAAEQAKPNPALASAVQRVTAGMAARPVARRPVRKVG